MHTIARSQAVPTLNSLSKNLFLSKETESVNTDRDVNQILQNELYLANVLYKTVWYLLNRLGTGLRLFTYVCSASLGCWKEQNGSVWNLLSNRFPLNNSRKLKKWLTNMNLEDWTPSRFSVLCIHHFEEQYIDRTGKNVTLRGDAVPTIFSSSKIITQQEKKVCAFLSVLHGNICLHLSHNFLLTPIVYSLKNKQTNISYVKLAWTINNEKKFP